MQRLHLDEMVHIDGGFLGEVIAQLGPLRGGELIRDAVASMAADLDALAEAVHRPADPGAADPLTGTAAVADRLSRIAWEVGLTTLSGVALDLAHCAERGDDVALRAVAARLQRVGLQSLNGAIAEAALLDG